MDFSIIGKENPHFPRINYDGYRIIRTADKIRYMVNRLFGWTELRNCLDFLLNGLRCIRGVIDGSSAVLLDKDKMLIFKYLYYLVCS